MPLFDRVKKEVGEAVDKADDVIDAVVDKADDVVDAVVDEVREHVPGGDEVADQVPEDAGEQVEEAIRDKTDSSNN